MVEVKRKPGIPHETLAHIAEQAGGLISYVQVGRTVEVRLDIGSKTFQATTNTKLLIEVFKVLGESKE